MKHLSLLLISVFFYSIVVAQDNFLGNWVFRDKKTLVGQEYINALPQKMAVAKNHDTLVIETASTGSNSEDVKGQMKFVMNDKLAMQLTDPVSKRQITYKFKSSPDKKSLTFTSTISAPGNTNEIEITREENWTLSSDGKQLFIHLKSVGTEEETWELEGAFEKS